MASIPAVVAAATSAFTSLNLSRSLPLARITHCRLRSVIAASSLSNTEFNITFAPPKPKPSPPAIISTSKSDNDSEEQLYTPWIVRDGKGNPAPASLLHAMAIAKTSKKKKTKTKTKAKSESAPKSKPATFSTEPKYSKAARRFYNENFRNPAQRLSKILAAAGGNAPLLLDFTTSFWLLRVLSLSLLHILIYHNVVVLEENEIL